MGEYLHYHFDYPLHTKNPLKEDWGQVMKARIITQVFLSVPLPHDYSDQIRRKNGSEYFILSELQYSGRNLVTERNDLNRFETRKTKKVKGPPTDFDIRTGNRRHTLTHKLLSYLILTQYLNFW